MMLHDDVACVCILGLCQNRYIPECNVAEYLRLQRQGELNIGVLKLVLPIHFP